MPGDTIGEVGSEGNCPPPWFARGLMAVGIVDGGTGGWAIHRVGSTHISSKAATGIHALAKRSIISNLATTEYHGTTAELRLLVGPNHGSYRP